MSTDRRASETQLAFIVFLAFAVLAAVYRAAPYYLFDVTHTGVHYLWNFAPIGALALFAGSRLRSANAWWLPLVVMFISDLLLIYPLAQMDPPYPSFSLIRTPIIYLAFVAYVGLGRLVRPRDMSPPVLGGMALLGSVPFFVLTNFASWLVDMTMPNPMYTATFEGLGTCFLAGIPFYKNTLASDLLFTGLIFGIHAVLVWASQKTEVTLVPAGVRLQPKHAHNVRQARHEVRR